MANLCLTPEEFNSLFKFINVYYDHNYPNFKKETDRSLWTETVCKLLGGMSYKHASKTLLKFGPTGVFNAALAEKFKPDLPKLAFKTFNSLAKDFQLFLTETKVKLSRFPGLRDDDFKNFKIQMNARFDEFYRFREKGVLDKCEQRSKIKQTSLDAESAKSEFQGGQQNSPLLPFQQLALKFYENISSRDYKDAWNLLDDAVKNRPAWKGNFEMFERGYMNTTALKNIQVLKSDEISRGLYKVKIYYQDIVSLFVCTELTMLQLCYGQNLKNLETYYEQLKRKVLENGGIGFEKIPLTLLLQPNASELIWYKCQIPQDKLYSVFDNRKILKTNRVVNIVCKSIDGSPKIVDIVKEAVSAA